MKRSGFKRKTYAEIIAQQEKSREKQLARYRARGPKIPKEKKKPKPDRIKTLKDKTWAIFSKYIRRSYADKYGMVITCDGQYLHWKSTHCGHLFANSERSKSLGGNELWYFEKNFAPQSSNGNYFNANDSAKKYMLWAIEKYGLEEVQRMERMKNTPRKFTELEFEVKYNYYKTKFEKLEHGE